jgi:hypothetical protein
MVDRAEAWKMKGPSSLFERQTCSPAYVASQLRRGSLRTLRPDALIWLAEP